MRVSTAMLLILSAAPAWAQSELDDAHKQALQGRNAYWNCLAREYSRTAAGKVSTDAFSADIAGACPSERQNFRVTLLSYLSLQFPSAEEGAHLITVNKAIELAQKDVITAFVNRKAAK